METGRGCSQVEYGNSTYTGMERSEVEYGNSTYKRWTGMGNSFDRGGASVGAFFMLFYGSYYKHVAPLGL